jgi:hypothetical protein
MVYRQMTSRGQIKQALMNRQFPDPVVTLAIARISVGRRKSKPRPQTTTLPATAISTKLA